MLHSFFKSRKHHIVFALYFLLFGGLVAVFTSFINYNIEYTNIENKIVEKAQWEKQSKEKLARNFLLGAESQVWALATNPLTELFSHLSSDNNRKNLEHLLLATAEANHTFMQVRLIDAMGMERVRVDRVVETNRPRIVAPHELQDKSTRYYFKEASQIPYGQFWHSKMDLNRERGQIEQPIRPTFRIATPVFANNQFTGLILINLEIDELLNNFGASSEFDIYVADKNGEFIVHPDKDQAWGQYLEGRVNVLRQFPAFGSKILEHSQPASAQYFSFPVMGDIKNREGFQLILIPKDEVLEKLAYNNLLTTIMIAAVVVVISIPLSWLVAIGPTRLQDNLRRALEKIRHYQSVIDRNIITSTTDKNGVITSVSSKFLRIAGRATEEMIGNKHNVIRHPDTPDEIYKDLWGTITQGIPWRGEIQNVCSDGSFYWLDSIITPEVTPTGEVSGYMSVSHNISDKKEIERLSVTDQLTGLYNRRHLDDVLDSEIARHKRYGGALSLIICDIDKFKSVNDDLGHQAGDKVLVAFAGLMQSCIRQTDTIGRWGGEEFAVICSETSLENALVFAEKLRAVVEAGDFSIERQVTASFGVSEFGTSDTPDLLLSRADKALYMAKDHGRNCVKSAGDFS
ncbi:MAG: diguanylate cyclase [Rhodospirillales bacterium]|jgi:diguanylate cyclase (GGDEF)-like protein/PAS domain S-box-containing protein|nr:diguanylate cyclase [Rhodospirillales bacterium]